MDSINFHYNADNLLESYLYTTPDDSGSLQVIDSLEYDNQKNISAIKSFQLINGEWFPCCLVEYTYDEYNNRISRSNYNNFGWGMEPQGVFTYYYNENNQLIYHEMSLIGNLFERANYIYNEAGQRTEIVVELFESWTNSWNYSSKTMYEYDNQGNNNKINYYFWENNWILTNFTALSFDEAGNCLQRAYYSGGSLADRISYTYDMETEIENVIMPVHPEPFFRAFDQFKNRPVSYSWETVDDNGVMVYICDFNFYYTDLNSTNIFESSYDKKLLVYPNPVSEQLQIHFEGMKMLEISNSNGVLVFQERVEEASLQYDVGSLSPGFYFVRAFDGKQWYSTKVIIQ